MGKPLVIALLGRAGSGKSTTAQYIQDKLDATRISFAGPLKGLAKHLMGFTDEQVYGSEKEVIDSRVRGLLSGIDLAGHEFVRDAYTPRVFLQRLGNGAREFIHNRVWIEAAIDKAVNGTNQIYVIDDCRYVNEAEAIHADPRIDGRVIKIDGIGRQSDADPNHPSEAQVDQVPSQFIDFLITNDISNGLDTLHAEVDLVLEKLSIG